MSFQLFCLFFSDTILKFMDVPVDDNNPLIPLMKCVICKRFPIYEKFSCEQQHLLCRSCILSSGFGRRNRKKCRLCVKDTESTTTVQTSSSTTSTARVSTLDIAKVKVIPLKLGSLEVIYENSTFTCPYHQCEFFGKGAELKLHMITCAYRLVISYLYIYLHFGVNL